MVNDLCLAFGIAGFGLLVVSARLNLISRRDRRIAKAHLARCRGWGLKTEHIAKGAINNITLVVSRRLVRQFGRRVATLEAYADWLKRELAEVRAGRPHVAIHDGEMEGALLDEGSVVALRKEANGATAV
jgi:hypothetical protein